MSKKGIFIDRIGEIKYSNKYRMNMTIVAYRKAKDIDVLFEDGYLMKNTTYYRFKEDSIRRPSDAPYVYVGDAVGRKAKMLCGLWAEIIDVTGTDPRNLTYTIRFEDGLIKTTTKYSKFTSGCIGHPNINIKGKSQIRSDRVGETVYSERYSMKMTIKAYRRFNDIDVEFEDGVVVEHKFYNYFLEDKITRPDIKTYTSTAIGRKQKMNCGLMAEIICPSASGKAGYFDVKFEDGVIVNDKDLYNFMKGEVRHPKYTPGYCKIQELAKKYVGQRKKNNAGFEMEIIAYHNASDIDVKFDDGFVVYHTRMNQWNKGAIQGSPEQYMLKYIGKTNYAKNGQLMTVIGGNSANDLVIQFEDGTIVKNKAFGNFVTGMIGNPKCPTKGKFYYYGVYVDYIAYVKDSIPNYYCTLFDGSRDIFSLSEIKQTFG